MCVLPASQTRSEWQLRQTAFLTLQHLIPALPASIVESSVSAVLPAVLQAVRPRATAQKEEEELESTFDEVRVAAVHALQPAVEALARCHQLQQANSSGSSSGRNSSSSASPPDAALGAVPQWYTHVVAVLWNCLLADPGPTEAEREEAEAAGSAAAEDSDLSASNASIMSLLSRLPALVPAQPLLPQQLTGAAAVSVSVSLDRLCLRLFPFLCHALVIVRGACLRLIIALFTHSSSSAATASVSASASFLSTSSGDTQWWKAVAPVALRLLYASAPLIHCVP